MAEDTNGTMDEADDSEALASWIDEVPALVMRLETWHTPDHFSPDLSVGSLQVLEEALVFTYEPGRTDDSQDFLQGAMAYLGEALMHIGGGQWGLSGDGHPVVVPDPELRVDALDLLHLVITAQERNDCAVFEEAAGRLRSAVTARREKAPGWKPVKEATPGLDPWEPEESHPWLAQWLDARRAGFDDWIAEAGIGAALWDFSPGSLDVLGRLLLSRFKAREELEAREDDSFVQGAVWYVGEVAVRHRAGVWEYRRPGEDTSPDDPYAGRPFVNQPTLRDGGADVPMDSLMVALDDEDETALRERLDWYQNPGEAGDAPVVYRRRPPAGRHRGRRNGAQEGGPVR